MNSSELNDSVSMNFSAVGDYVIGFQNHDFDRYTSGITRFIIKIGDEIFSMEIPGIESGDGQLNITNF